MGRGSDSTAEITVDVAVVSVYVNDSYCLTYVAVCVAGVGVYVIGRLALKATNVALVVAVGIEDVRDRTSEVAYVALGIAGIVEFVSYASYVIASVALGVANIIEEVKAFPRSDKCNILGCRVGTKSPYATIGKSPTGELVTILYGSRRLTYERADVYSDMAELRAVSSIKGYGHLITF